MDDYSILSDFSLTDFAENSSQNIRTVRLTVRSYLKQFELIQIHTNIGLLWVTSNSQTNRHINLNLFCALFKQCTYLKIQSWEVQTNLFYSIHYFSTTTDQTDSSKSLLFKINKIKAIYFNNPNFKILCFSKEFTFSYFLHILAEDLSEGHLSDILNYESGICKEISVWVLVKQYSRIKIVLFLRVNSSFSYYLQDNP